jgi:hypothetical protein
VVEQDFVKGYDLTLINIGSIGVSSKVPKAIQLYFFLVLQFSENKKTKKKICHHLGELNHQWLSNP